jgi:hypothetical protein
MSETHETDVLLSNQIFDRVPPDECCDQLQELCEKLERERNQYRRNLELIAEDCESWLNSESDEPSADFIRLVAKYARESIK